MTEHSALSLPCGKASRHSDLLWVLERFLAEHKRSDLVLLQENVRWGRDSIPFLFLILFVKKEG